jgi:hypothetical protein
MVDIIRCVWWIMRIVEDSTLVIVKKLVCNNTTSNRSSLVDLLHHGFFSGNMSDLFGMINFIVILGPASFVSWCTVVANELLRAFDTVIVTSGSVNGTCFICDLVIIHPFESIVGFSTMASIISGTRSKDLWSNVNIRPCCPSGNLDSVGKGRGCSLSPA